MPVRRAAKKKPRRTSRGKPKGKAKEPTALRRLLKGQYHAALAMLRQAIERTPEHVWTSDAYPNRTWRMAYHTLYYTHLYLGKRLQDFRPWPQHQTHVQDMDDVHCEPELDEFLELPDRPPLTGRPYSPAQVLSYWSLVDDMVDHAVDAMDLGAKESGFPWAKLGKAEHQMMNIRHIQHHTAQLADRLRNRVNVGVDWVRSKQP
jgi:hypothetical protein